MRVGLNWLHPNGLYPIIIRQCNCSDLQLFAALFFLIRLALGIGSIHDQNSHYCRLRRIYRI
jgi:hypothetical protein